jgi:ABC-2 type transport system ATP-binding protein
VKEHLTMSEIITIRKLSKQYNPPHGPLAINEIDLQIQEGEIFSLLGPNGAGKTTLIAVLCGLFPPTSGDAMIAGHSVVQDPMAVKQIIGVVPEEIALYPQLSGRQNLRYFGLLYGLSGHELDRAIDDVLTVIGLADRARDKVGSYSNGMKRRLNVGVGLLHKPRIVLLDEPTLGLDPESRRRILDLVLQLKHEVGATILYTTHYMEEAQELSDRVGIIHHGKIIALGTPDELIQRLHVEDTLRLSVGVSEVSVAVVDALQRVRGVKQVSVGGDAITLSLLDAAEVLPQILRIMEESGVGVGSLTVQQPNLEAVFLRLTGERLTVVSG